MNLEKENLYLLICAVIFITIWLIISYPLYFHADEAWHMAISNHPNVRNVLTYNYQSSVHPPLYYIILHFWQKISFNVFWIRLLSLLCFLMSIPVLYRIGSQLMESFPEHKTQYQEWRFWLIAVTLLSPLTITIAIEIREYSLLWLFLTLQFLYFLKLWQAPILKNVCIYFILSLITLMSHYSAVLSTAILGMTLLYRYFFNIRHYKALSSIVISNMLLAICFFISFYSHTHHDLIDMNLYFKNDNYYTDFIPLIVIAIISTLFLIQPIGALFVFTLRCFFPSQEDLSFYRIIKLLSGISIILMLILNYIHIYPFPGDGTMRFVTWMMLTLIMVVAIQCQWLEATNKIGNIIIISMVMSFSAIFIAPSFMFPNLKKTTFEQTIEFLDDRNKNDVIITDIQTAQILSIEHGLDYSFADHSIIFHNKMWNDTPLYYPSHYLMDIADITTNELKGGIRLDKKNLLVMMETAQKHYDNIYVISVGFDEDANMLCPSIGENAIKHLTITNVSAYKIPAAKIEAVLHSCKG